jgi:hypothetical protein
MTDTVVSCASHEFKVLSGIERRTGMLQASTETWAQIQDSTGDDETLM